jgi:hypothetical protein
MGDFDPPYDTLSDALKATIRRTYDEKSTKNANFGWQLGFFDVHNKMTIADLLKAMDTRGDLAVLKDIEFRCRCQPGLWAGIRNVLGVWDYAGGHQVSEGFNFTCDDPDALQTLVAGSTKFCKDKFNVHGPRVSFREMITAGPGLHVCITEKASRGKDYPHDIHIDKFQTLNERTAAGECNTKVLSVGAAEQFGRHMWDVVPWWVGKQADELGEKKDKLIQDLKNIKPPFRRGP